MFSFKALKKINLILSSTFLLVSSLGLSVFGADYEFKSLEMQYDFTGYWWWLLWLGGIVLVGLVVAILFSKSTSKN